MSYDYDVVVIGGGAAGLTASGMAASFGAKTAMVEEKKLGGDCTWYGCVPSKALLKSAKIAHSVKQADKYGILTEKPSIDFSAVMKRIHTIQQDVYDDADAPHIYEKMGIGIIDGQAQFSDAHTIQIIKDGKITENISSRYFVIATGSHPSIPPIEGLDAVDYLTNETIFNLKKQPKKLFVVGGGPIGIEMAQAFQRLGSEVTVFEYAGEGTLRAGWFRGALLSFFLGHTRKDKKIIPNMAMVS
jgi:pyruvate/2-oxoglutarate dehydrogenase complex dihydrolipoamide dehydrogenase (E3) component